MGRPSSYAPLDHTNGTVIDTGIDTGTVGHLWMGCVGQDEKARAREGECADWKEE